MSRLLHWYANLSVRGKVLLPFMALFVIESLAAALIVGGSLQQKTYLAAHQNLRSLAALTAQNLGNSAQALGQQASLVTAQADLGVAVKGHDVARLTAAVAQIWWSQPPYLVEVLNGRGRTLTEISPDSILQQPGAGLRPMALAAGQIAAIVPGNDGHAAYLVGEAPITFDGTTVGRLVLVERVDDALLTSLNVGSGHDLAVVGSSGVVASTVPGLDGQPWAMVPPTTTRGAVYALRGQSHLADAVPLSSQQDGSILWVAAAVALAPVRSAAAASWLQTWLIFAAGTLAAAVTAILVAARIARPLRELTEATARLSAGDFEAHAAAASRDEIGKLAGAFNLMTRELKLRTEGLDLAFREMRRLSETDPLTGLLNRRALQEHLEAETQRTGQCGGTLALVMLDIDGFKLLNDTYGHPAGDRVLCQVAEQLTRLSRAGDRAGRYGGDEFMLVLHETSLGDAEGVAARLREAQAAAPFVAPDGRRIPVRLSVGVADYPIGAADANELIACADANLYASKRRGGDTITSHDHHAPRSPAATTTFGMLEALVTAVDNKDSYTRRHSEQVTAFALDIADCLGISTDTQDALRVAGLLHDVGKIGVPDHILHKPGPLSAEEFAAMKQHPLLGESIITAIDDLEDIRAAVVSHHERFDGGGYPRGLAGEEIPLLGRILAVADAYSAMITDRPYRQALCEGEALEQIRLGARSQFDPLVVDAFLLTRQQESIAEKTIL